MNLASIGIINSTGLETEVVAFATATGITNGAMILDLDNLVKSLKGYGIWSLMKAIYPIVGGNATAHSYNLKDTSLYQITWNGSITHSATGITGNGSTGYGNTGIVPSSVLSLNSTHISCYIRTNSDTSSPARMNMGTNNASAANSLSIQAYPTVFLSVGINGSVANTNSAGGVNGLMLANRTGSATGSANCARNGSVITSGMGASTGLSANALALMARNNNGTVDMFSLSEYAFFTVGDGLTGTQIGNLYTAVQAFQTARGRQV